MKREQQDLRRGIIQLQVSYLLIVLSFYQALKNFIKVVSKM